MEKLTTNQYIKECFNLETNSFQIENSSGYPELSERRAKEFFALFNEIFCCNTENSEVTLLNSELSKTENEFVKKIISEKIQELSKIKKINFSEKIYFRMK